MAGVPENPIPAIDDDLKRALGPIHLIALGIGAIIGAGIFVLTGHAAATYAGPGVVSRSPSPAPAACSRALLCRIRRDDPRRGQRLHLHLRHAWPFRRLDHRLELVLEYLAAGSTVAVGWSGYFADFMAKQLHIARLTNGLAGRAVHARRRGPLPATGAYFNLPAVALVALVTTVLIIGVNMSANFNNVMVAIKLCIVLAVIFVGFSQSSRQPHAVDSAEHGHLRPIRLDRRVPRHRRDLLRLYRLRRGDVAAQEARNPQRDVPLGILGSLSICTVLYMLMSWVLTGIAPYAP